MENSGRKKINSKLLDVLAKAKDLNLFPEDNRSTGLRGNSFNHCYCVMTHEEVEEYLKNEIKEMNDHPFIYHSVDIDLLEVSKDKIQKALLDLE
jgi:hypothetical protein